jgi:hypothetical protein
MLLSLVEVPFNAWVGTVGDQKHISSVWTWDPLQYSKQGTVNKRPGKMVHIYEWLELLGILLLTVGTILF